jgi:hypothetical protein
MQLPVFNCTRKHRVYDVAIIGGAMMGACIA